MRFMTFDIFATGVLFFEWAFKFRWSSLVQERRTRFFARPFVFFAIVSSDLMLI